MPLSPGTRVGSFEVISALGAGGMGEVYRARDSRLDREVALKVLPEAFTSDPERLARFEREAKLLASLNHPNIAQVYGYEAAAIAMELVEGPTLDEIINGTAPGEGGVPRSLPLDRALGIARQIATALEAAHDQGIIHRDLKPANVKVREDGAVKVLDFGLAKAFAADAEAAASAVSNSPTLTARSTQLGMILGTAAYMAPEQAKGRAVDRRADVWAFGVVLFEMLAGRRAFEGDDVSDVLASVLKTEPDWNALPADLPGPVRRLIQRCLVKDPKRRLRDVAEGLLQMDEGMAAASASASAISAASLVIPAPISRPLWRRALPIVATAIAAAALVFAIDQWRTPAPVAQAPIRLQHMQPSDAPVFTSQSLQDLTISPDGQTIAFVELDSNHPPSLWTRRLDQLEATRVRGGETAGGPFISPDNAWLGFLDAGDPTLLKKVSILGGPPTQVTKGKSGIIGATWTDDGFIIFSEGAGSSLQIVGEGGGEAKPLTQLDSNEGAHVWPSAIPGTKIVLFTTTTGGLTPASGGQLAAIDRRSNRVARLKIPGVHPRWVPTGHVIYATADGTLRAIRFDPKTMTVSGNPVPVMEGVGVKLSGAAQFDVARDGRLVYSGGSANLIAARTLAWVDRAGKETPIAAPARSYFYARLSPDGTRVATDVRDADQNTWIWDLKRETLLRLTDKPGQYQYGLWTPESQRVVFSTTGNPPNLFQMRPDGTGQMEQVTDLSKEKLTPYPNAVTPDGKQVIFRATVAANKNDLFVAPLTGSDHTATKLLATDHDEKNAAVSPDGKWFAFESDLTGHNEVYVRPFPNADAAQFPISTTGGFKPAWAGREIFYLTEDGRMMAVSVDTTKGFVAGKPVELFKTGPYFTGAVGRNYDTIDGKRFIMVKNVVSAGASQATPIVIVVNWAEELRGKVK